MKSNFVRLHPYFKVHPGKMDAIKAMLPRFVEKTATEKAVLFYEFSMNGDELFCREAYENAEGLLAHLDNVGALLAEAMKVADLTRIEVHGPAAELEKLKKPLAHLKPKFFALKAEIQKSAELRIVFCKLAP
jgi:quinol monooxygenase YgiN